MNKTNRSKAVEKFIKHNHKFHLMSADKEYQRKRFEYGVIDNCYITDNACLVKTSEDLSNQLQSEKHGKDVMERLLKGKDANDNVGMKYKIDFNRLINDAKENGFKDTFKQQKEESSYDKLSHVVYIDGACYYLRLINKAFQCINDGKISTLTQVKRPYGTKGNYTKALHIETSVGECYLLNFTRTMETGTPLKDDFENLYNLLDYVIK